MATSGGMTARQLARELLAQGNGNVNVDTMFARALEERLDPVEVDRAVDALMYGRSLKVVRRDFTADDTVDLSHLPATRVKIQGTGHYLGPKDRGRYDEGPRILVPEPSNRFDRNAIAVFVDGRQVGYIGAGTAASLSSVLQSLGAAAFRVNAAPPSPRKSSLWVLAPKLAEVRRFAKAQAR